MKQLICSLLVGSMLLVGTAFAADTQQKATVKNADGTQTITISLATIEEVMTQYSPSMKKIVKDRDTATSQYIDIWEQMDDLQTSISDAKDFTVGIQLSKQYESLEDSAAKLKLSSDTAKEQCRLNVYQQVSSAKQQYLTYTLDAGKLSTLNAQLTAQTKTSTHAKQLFESGYLSKKSYDDMVQATHSLSDSVRAQQTVLDADSRTLRVLLGVPETAKLQFEEPNLEKFDFAQILNLKLEEDTKEMLQNSVQLKNAQLTYESYRDHDYAKSAQEDAAKLAWEQAQKTAVENLKTLHQNLQDGYKALLTARAGLATQQSALASAESKRSHGYLSDQAVTELRNQTASLQLTVKAQEIALYSSLLSYQQLKTV